ncbi:MAG: hypothetical protein IPK82_00205 [Polyangiaceae bacterium]|nr:hypothetical protein [Polyangiaceae bacterium]
MGTLVALRFFLRRSRNNANTPACVAAVRVRNIALRLIFGAALFFCGATALLKTLHLRLRMSLLVLRIRP